MIIPVTSVGLYKSTVADSNFNFQHEEHAQWCIVTNIEKKYER